MSGTDKQLNPDQPDKDRAAVLELRATADHLAIQTEQLTVAWEAVDVVDTNYGVEAEEAGHAVVSLVNALTGMTGERDPLRTWQLQRYAMELHEAIDRYAELDEHNTKAGIDILDRLMPGIALARRAMEFLDSPTGAQRVTVGELIEQLHQFPSHMQVWFADPVNPEGYTPLDRTVTLGVDEDPAPGEPSSFVVLGRGGGSLPDD
ncbi:hypothetical protein MOQ72_27165 [Saccharopolyspora sp. K220]|uniref:hypothetical protein n=1 Tax=Saccharopolyspora soli TaxID=2926618 RepID=UPI001F5A0F32|nr:hypothetical protein [Saccharopolyspora soli]MCI2421129.1 hypothetical protein [Saccharopolyspora soli]